jgi:hypothetical protein
VHYCGQFGAPQRRRTGLGQRVQVIYRVALVTETYTRAHQIDRDHMSTPHRKRE